MYQSNEHANNLLATLPPVGAIAWGDGPPTPLTGPVRPVDNNTTKMNMSNTQLTNVPSKQYASTCHEITIFGQ